MSNHCWHPASYLPGERVSSSDLGIEPHGKRIGTEISAAAGKKMKLQTAGVGNTIVQK